MIRRNGNGRVFRTRQSQPAKAGNCLSAKRFGVQDLPVEPEGPEIRWREVAGGRANGARQSGIAERAAKSISRCRTVPGGPRRRKGRKTGGKRRKRIEEGRSDSSHGHGNRALRAWNRHVRALHGKHGKHGKVRIQKRTTRNDCAGSERRSGWKPRNKVPPGKPPGFSNKHQASSVVEWISFFDSFRPAAYSPVS